MIRASRSAGIDRSGVEILGIALGVSAICYLPLRQSPARNSETLTPQLGMKSLSSTAVGRALKATPIVVLLAEDMNVVKYGMAYDC